MHGHDGQRNRDAEIGNEEDRGQQVEPALLAIGGKTESHENLQAVPRPTGTKKRTPTGKDR
jgi:hypothetical protein